MLNVGDLAPPFRGTDQSGRSVDLEEILRSSIVVLYFYPKDFTRVCTKQACLFRDTYEDLQTQGVTVVGVSLDAADSHRRFSERHELPFSLLADESREIAKAYGVLRLFGLFTKRVTYVIDRDRRILGVFHHELSADKHLAEVRDLLAGRAASQVSG